jgi:hypothetical protein
MTKDSEWEMYIYTFPYWFIIDKDGLNKILTVKIDGAELKFYPPYRTSPANNDFSLQPDVALFPNGKMEMINPNFKMPKLAVYPLFNDNGVGINGYQGEVSTSWNINRKDRKDIPVDTIRVDVKSSEDFNVLFHLRKLIEIVRVLSRQWWIGKMPYFLDFIQVVQTIDEKGFSINEFPPEKFSSYYYVSNFKERVIDYNIWDFSLTHLASKIYPKIYRTLLMDAIYYITNGDYRRVILDLANALDTAVDNSFYNIWLKKGMGTPGNFSRKVFIKDIPVKEGLKFNSKSNIPLLISHIAKFVSEGRSFEAEFQDDFIMVDEFWNKKRNFIAHGSMKSISNKELTEYLISIERCVNWLETL